MLAAGIDLVAKLLGKTCKITVLLRTDGIIVYAKQNTVRVVLRIQAEQKFAKFKACSIAALAPH